jgi:hypothetical protein
LLQIFDKFAQKIPSAWRTEAYGVYILDNTPLGARGYKPMSFGRKNMKRRSEKGAKC